MKGLGNFLVKNFYWIWLPTIVANIIFVFFVDTDKETFILGVFAFEAVYFALTIASWRAFNRAMNNLTKHKENNT